MTEAMNNPATAPLNELQEQANYRNHVMGHMADAIALMAAGSLGPSTGYILMCTIPNPSFETNGGPSTMVHMVSNLNPEDVTHIVAGYIANPAPMEERPRPGEATPSDFYKESPEEKEFWNSVRTDTELPGTVGVGGAALAAMRGENK